MDEAVQPQQQSQAPAGWYPSGQPRTERWWNGSGWSELERPAGTGLARGQLDPSGTRTLWSWLLALSPIAAVVFATPIAFFESGSDLTWTSFVFLLVGLGLALWFANKDRAALEARGFGAAPNILWILLGDWVYLLVRAIRLKNTGAERWWVFVTSSVVSVLLIALGAFGAWVALTIYSESRMEDEIAAEFTRQTNIVAAVDCPPEVEVSEGESFTCTISSSTLGVRQSFDEVRVVWTDDYGSYSWTAE